ARGPAGVDRLEAGLELFLPDLIVVDAEPERERVAEAEDARLARRLLADLVVRAQALRVRVEARVVFARERAEATGVARAKVADPDRIRAERRPLVAVGRPEDPHRKLA